MIGLPNPYLIGGVALLITTLAAANVTLYQRGNAALTRAESEAARADRAEKQADEIARRQHQTNQVLTNREAELRKLRADYDARSRTIRTALDTSGCADSSLPADIARVFMAPGQN